MKKRFLLFGILCLFAGLSVSAQQLPNVGFENWKPYGKAGSSESFGEGLGTFNGMRQRPGSEPMGWNGSSVNQKVFLEKQDTLVLQDITGGFTGKAALLMNKFVGAGGIGSIAPGYITLGTPWVYAVTNVNVCDGGTYGGVEFTYTPDALTGLFQRTDANAETSTIIAYLWNGTFKSKVGKAGAPATERDNVDRAIMNRDNAGTITGDGKLVASVEQTTMAPSIEGSWTSIDMPLNYVKGAGAPTMMNVIVCAGDYWNRSSLVDKTSLRVDDLRFVYYSRLKSLSVNGIPVPGFKDDVYSYEMGTDMPALDQIKYEVLGRSATCNVTSDVKKGTVTLTVSNDGADKDNLSTHAYVLQFNKPIIKREGAKYDGTIDIDFLGSISHLDKQSIYIEFAPDGNSCKFSLYDFSLDGNDILGDIIIENVEVKFNTAGTERYFKGAKDGLTLADGQITANAKLDGTEDFYSGHLVMDIPVEWIPAPGQVLPIKVKFNGGIDKTSGVENIQNANATAYGVNGALVVKGFDGMARVYSMDGRLVKAAWVNTETQLDLTKGLYVVRLGNKAVKVIVK